MIAQETRDLTNTLIGLSDEVVRERAGAVQPAKAEYAKENVTVNELNDQQFQAWREPVGYKKNTNTYTKTYEQTGSLLGGADQAREFADFLWELSREQSVPSDPNELEVTSWWDDHLGKI